jgi:uncharacterized protein YegL
MIRGIRLFALAAGLLILCIGNFAAQAQVRFNLFAPETKAYPQVRTFYQALDNNDAPIQGLDSNDFDVFENGIRIPASAITKRCSTIIDGPALSVVLVIDKSASMSEVVGPGPDDTRFKFVKNASKLFIQLLNFIDPTAVAIVSFDGQSYLEQPFSNNKNVLFQAIDKIELGTATLYDPPLLHKQWGAIKLLSERPPEPVKRVIIFLTDGEPNRKPTVDSIRKGLSDNGIYFYAITAYTGMNADLASFAKETGGDAYEANSRDASTQLLEIFEKIAAKLQAKEVCYLQWKSPMGCDDSSRKRTVDITLKKGFNIKKSVQYLAPPSSVLKIDVTPPIVAFGNPAPSTPVTAKVKVTARTGQLTLTGFNLSSSPGGTFRITDWNGTTPIVIDSGKSRDFTVEFTQGAVQDYRQGTLIFAGTPCSPGPIPLVGGAANVVLLDPITAQVKSTCNDLVILWGGVDSAQQVIIQYSSDNGTTWNLITDQATGLQYVWPADELKKLNFNGQYKIRVGLPSSKTYVWAKQVGGTLADSSTCIALSSDGLYAYVSGTFVGNGTFDGQPISSAGGSRDGFFAQLDAAGNVLYSRTIGGTNDDQISGIAAGPGGIAFITGWYIGDATFGSLIKSQASDKTKRNYFMARVETNGTTAIVHDLGPRANAQGEAYGEQIAFDPADGRIYVQGMFRGNIVDASTSIRLSSTRPSVWQPFTAVYSPDGRLLDLQPVRTVGKPYTTNKATDPDGCLYETGTFTGSIVRGSRTLNSAGQTDGYITKYCGLPPSSSASPLSFPLAKAKLYSVDSNIRFNVGSTAVGQPKEVTLSTGICNGGNLDTFIDSVTVSDPQFQLKTVLTGRLFPSVNCDTVPIEVLFDPTSPGEHCATITFYASCSPIVTMRVCGTAVEPCNYTYPTDATFTNTLVNGSTNLTINNAFCNTSNIIIDGKLKLSGANPGDFRIVEIQPGYGTNIPNIPDTTFSVRPGQCLQLRIDFRPTAIGTRTALLDLGLPADCGAARIVLQGNGIAPLQINAGNINWGCVSPNTTDSKTLKISNVGGGDATIQSISLKKNDGTFRVRIPALPITPFTLAAGRDTTVTVDFTPATAVAGLFDSILVTASANSQTITSGGRLQGDGCIGTAAYDTNCFAATAIGARATRPDAFIIRNTGNAPLNVLQITPLGTSEFINFTPAPPFTVQPGGSAPIAATFAPLFAGNRLAGIKVITNGSKQIDTVTVCGEGFSADTTINFGNVLVCETPSVTVPYVNASAGSIRIDVAMAGTDPSQFTISRSGSVVISANSTVDFTVSFAPQQAGTFSGIARIGQRNVNMNGTARIAPVKVFSSPEKYENVLPGKPVLLIVKARIDDNLGTASVDTMDVKLTFSEQNLSFANKITTKIPGWTWNSSFDKTSVTVGGRGSSSLPARTDVELFEAEFNAYLGDTNSFAISVDAGTSATLTRCLNITETGSNLTLSPMCFQNGRFIRGSGLGYALRQTGPLPAADQAVLEYSVGLSGHTILELYNSMGQKITTLLEGSVQEGTYEMQLHTGTLPSGIYTCVMRSGPYSTQLPLIISK